MKIDPYVWTFLVLWLKDNDDSVQIRIYYHEIKKKKFYLGGDKFLCLDYKKNWLGGGGRGGG